jgi:amino acid adenylation domain-containing protein
MNNDHMLQNSEAKSGGLSGAQEQIWFSEQLSPDSSAFNIANVMQICGELDVLRVRQCIVELLQRHASLRAQFSYVNGEPQQEVLPMSSLKVTEIFFEANIEDGYTLLKGTTLLKEFVNRPFSLNTAPLIRVLCLKTGRQQFILSFVLHHIICDGWSLGVLFSEFFELYKVNGSACGLSVSDFCPLSYADYQKKSIQSGFFDAGLTYWTQKLEKTDGLLDLYKDGVRPQKDILAAKKYHYTLDDELYVELMAFMKQRRTSIFPLLVSALYALIHYFSAQQDLILGIPFLNRADKNTMSWVGLMVNVLPIRVQLTKDMTFLMLLEQVKQAFSEAMKQEAVPFQEILKSLQLSRTANQLPLFQLMAVQGVELEPFVVEGLHVTPLEVPTDSIIYDLAFYFRRADNQIQLVCDYAQALFQEKTIQHFVKTWETILWQMIKDETQRVMDTDYLCGQGLSSVSHYWSLDQYHHEKHHTIIHYFQRVVSNTPEKIALVFENQQMTYRELDILSNHIATDLLAHAVHAGDVVATCLPRGIFQIASILGILKVNATFLCLDYMLSVEKQKVILQEAVATAVLVQSSTHLEESFGECVVVTVLDSWQEVIYKESAFQYYPVLNEATYLIHTSGSVGKAKLVIGTERGLLNRLHWGWETYPFEESERCVHQASIVFVDAIAEILSPLLQGIPLIIFSREILLDPLAMLNAIKFRQITRILLIPSLLRLLLDVCEKEKEYLPLLKIVMSSGEALSRSLCEHFFKVFDRKILVNIYGSSEVAADATYFEMKKMFTTKETPIGSPLRNTSIYLLNENQQIVPRGVMGEIYIAGKGVSLGYKGNVELTKEKFIKNPFSKNIQDLVLYRTGDYGYFSTDGVLYYLGRMDKQVKIRGVRVELAEIEYYLLQYPGVCDAAVTVEEQDGEKLLVAYLVKTRDQLAFSAKEIRQYLRHALSEREVPALFYEVAVLVRTSTGKIDRKNLNTIKADEIRETLNEQTIALEIDRVILSVWENVLGHANIGIEDNFFDSGGHSLKLVQLRDELQRGLSQPIQLMDLFNYPTIRSFREFVSKKNEPKEKRQKNSSLGSDKIAIVGMAVRLPDATTLSEFWNNLVGGHCAIKDLPGLTQEVIDNTRKHRIYRSAVLRGIDEFDASFFGIAPREAELLDPQHRIFLELVWESLETAGYDLTQYSGKVGLFAGCSPSTYFLQTIWPTLDTEDPAALFEAITRNNENYLTTHIAYELDFKGPCASIQTACSTSLVAVQMACRALQVGDADMMLAGGVTIKVPQDEGYLYQPGLIVSPQGICRVFDEGADGTVFSNGAGVVVLKRLADAINDRDKIYGVICGAAVNNDGRSKVGYVAPSIHGQREVIEAALSEANLDVNSISYIEAHGTGTALGDKIELTALKEVFKFFTSTHSVGLGSVKTNLGHLDAAAGVVGLIKTTLAIDQGIIPPSLHYQQANEILASTDHPFEVVNEGRSWPIDQTIRRAGVSSFGIGGTNAHIIVEEAQRSELQNFTKKPVILTLSAKTSTALTEMKNTMCKYFQTNKNILLGDVAYTLNIGRKAFPYRWSAVIDSIQSAISALCSQDKAIENNSRKDVFFHFSPFLDIDYVKILCDENILFLKYLNQSFEIIRDSSASIFSAAIEKAIIDGVLAQEYYPAFLCIINYVLALTWIAHGVNPSNFLQDDTSNIMQDCLRGDLSLEHAINVISKKSLLEITEAWTFREECCIKYSSKEKESNILLLDITIGGWLRVLENFDGKQKWQEMSFSGSDAIEKTISALWSYGASIDWMRFYQDSINHRTALPTYPFERQRYWFKPKTTSSEINKNIGTHASSTYILNNRPEQRTPYRAPDSEIQEHITGLWQEILGIAPIGVDDDFYDLGGDSIHAQQIVSMINDSLSIDLSLANFFNFTSIELLSHIVEDLVVEKINGLSEEQKGKIFAE